MTNDPGNVLILGIGNILLGDEGIGSHVAQYIDEKGLPDKITCIDGGTGGFILLESMQKANYVVIVDATIDGKPLGTVTKLKPKYSKEYPNTITAHDIGLKDLLDAVYLLDSTPDVTLFTVSIQEMNELSTELSSTLMNKINDIVSTVLKEANKLSST